MCRPLFPVIYFLTSVFYLFLSASRLKGAFLTLFFLFLDHVTIDYFRPGLYYCDATQYRHCCTSTTVGHDSKPGRYMWT